MLVDYGGGTCLTLLINVRERLTYKGSLRFTKSCVGKDLRWNYRYVLKCWSQHLNIFIPKT